MASGLWVALLRGVNVGGNNKLPMRDLAELFRAAGCDDVATFIQSGNVVFRAERAVALEIPRVMPGRIGERFGFTPPVLLRSGAEMARIATSNPFTARGAEEDRVYVAFLADAPSADRIASLDPARSPPDVVEVIGAEAWLWFPRGLGRTKITSQYLDSRLGTVATVRNWRTTTKLAALTRSQ
jgi:uncharacterized protein (DUF1697 family)